jgi:ubiquinone/menaquinone biosynthesis C-methylase UbiE
MNILKNGLSEILKKTTVQTGYDLKRLRPVDVHHYLELYGKESVKNRRFYNISAGSYMGFGGGLHHPCWTNIDLDRPWKKTQYSETNVEYNSKYDISHDLLSMQPVPVESKVAELVHTRFTIASLTDEIAQYMFNEVYRILKNGGIFRISTPNIDLDYRAYFNNDITFFYWYGKNAVLSIEQAFLHHVATQLSTIATDGPPERIGDEQFRDLLKNNSLEDALNYCTSRCSLEIQKRNRQNHINWWNPQKLQRMLNQAGFKTVYLSTREQSAAPVMRNEVYFDNEDNKFVMYMEAVKS